MSIPDRMKSGKYILALLPIYLALAGLVLWQAIHFHRNRLSKVPISLAHIDLPILATSTKQVSDNNITLQSAVGLYVASRAGRTYYLSVCAFAKRIADKNRVWFKTEEGAIKAGYTKAKNCKEMK